VSRRRTGRPRGRPSHAHAKRRFTTRHGRKYGIERLDLGTDQLRIPKLLLTGREDLPLDGASILYAREQLDRSQYDTWALISRQLVRLTRGWGGYGGCGGLWAARTSATTITRSAPAPGAIDQRMRAAEYARERLAQACECPDGSRALVIALAEGDAPPIVRRLVERRLTIGDSATLEKLRQGLDRITKGRTRRKSAEIS
jgi:hypothetical protein